MKEMTDSMCRSYYIDLNSSGPQFELNQDRRYFNPKYLPNKNLQEEWREHRVVTTHIPQEVTRKAASGWLQYCSSPSSSTYS